MPRQPRLDARPPRLKAKPMAGRLPAFSNTSPARWNAIGQRSVFHLGPDASSEERSSETMTTADRFYSDFHSFLRKPKLNVMHGH